MQYFNPVLNQIVEAQEIKIRRGNKEDTGGRSDVAIPKYVIDKSYAHSDIEFLMRFSRELSSIKTPVKLKVEFDFDKESYPYNCPRYCVESIGRLHNEKVDPYNTPIGNLNPFASRAHRVLTLEQAQKIIEQNNKTSKLSFFQLSQNTHTYRI